jgi:hypothetical protein
MKIKNLQDIQNIKKEYRVIDSTYCPDEEKKAMIGGIFECRDIDFKHNLVGLYTQDKSRRHWFKMSDVQEVYPMAFWGQRLGFGTILVNNDETYQVIGCEYNNYEYSVRAVLIEEDGLKYKYPDILKIVSITETEMKLWKIDLNGLFEKDLSGKKVEVVIDGKTYNAVIE